MEHCRFKEVSTLYHPSQICKWCLPKQNKLSNSRCQQLINKLTVPKQKKICRTPCPLSRRQDSRRSSDRDASDHYDPNGAREKNTEKKKNKITINKNTFSGSRKEKKRMPLPSHPKRRPDPFSTLEITWSRVFCSGDDLETTFVVSSLL